MKFAYKTDRGLRRSKNEDAVRVLPESNFFMLADGAGGMKAGDVASKEALDALEDYVVKNPLDDIEGSEAVFDYFKEVVEYVSEYIMYLSEKEKAYSEMATTLVFAYIRKNILYVSNIGDSRVYFIHGDEIHQITEDHTYVNELVQMGAITKAEAEVHDKRNQLTRAIGAGADDTPDFFNIFLEKDDRILLCSDGLYGEVSEEDILKEILKGEDADKCVDNLVDMANRNGGSDNITVIYINMAEEKDEQ